MSSNKELALLCLLLAIVLVRSQDTFTSLKQTSSTTPQVTFSVQLTTLLSKSRIDVSSSFLPQSPTLSPSSTSTSQVVDMLSSGLQSSTSIVIPSVSISSSLMPSSFFTVSETPVPTHMLIQSMPASPVTMMNQLMSSHFLSSEITGNSHIERTITMTHVEGFTSITSSIIRETITPTPSTVSY